MDATRSLTSKKKGALPAFYQPPSSSTSAQIMAEARQSLRALPTDRPFTPAEPNRMLFGDKKEGNYSRPPSVYSIGARHFSESRPSTAQRLTPIEKSLPTQDTEILPFKPTPPTPVQSMCALPQSHSHTTLIWNEDRGTEHAFPSHSSLPSSRKQSLNEAHHPSIPPPPLPSSHSPSPSYRKRRVASADLLPRTKGIGGEGWRPEEGRRRGGEERGQRKKEEEIERSSVRRSSEPQRAMRGEMATGTAQIHRPQEKRERRRKSEAPPFWREEISPLLSQLSSSSSSQLDEKETIKESVQQLWCVLSRRGCVGCNGGTVGPKQRSAVLRVVFSLLDSTDPQMLARLSRIILAMEVSGNNLLNVCKLLFSLARTEENDRYFIEEVLVDPLVHLLSSSEPRSDSDAMVYGLATLKLLASNTDLRSQLSAPPTVSLLSSLLHNYNKLSSGVVKTTTVENILVQLTALLRNLSETSSFQPLLLSSDLLPLVAVALSNHLQHPDITFNISRLLSKLTLHGDCRAAVLQCPHLLPLLLHILTTHTSHPDILVRVCFILGNLTAESQEARHLIFSTQHTLPTHTTLTTITTLTTHTLEAELKQVKDKSTDSAKSVNEDLLIKLIRLLANLSVHCDIGIIIASDQPLMELLMRMLASPALLSYHELTAIVLAALNNISYFASSESYLVQQQSRLCSLLVTVLLEDNRESLLECVRVYGNLSRHKTVRLSIAEKKVNELLITLLDSSNSELVFASCGVLVNLMTDHTHRAVLAANGGVTKLLDVLRDLAQSDWQLAGLVCQTLWNFSEDMSSAVACFGEEETDQIITILQSYCNHSPSRNSPAETADYEHNWSTHFLPVGQTLLERIQQSHDHTNLIPLEHNTTH